MEIIQKFNKHIQLFVVTFMLISLNMYVIKFFDMEISRLIRVLSVFLFFAFFIIYRRYWKSFVFLALVLFTLRDLLIINYEVSAYKTYSFVFTILAYTVLISYSIKKLNFSRFTPTILIFALCMIGLNVFNLFYLSEVLKDGLDNNFQLILFYVQGIVILILGFSAYLYYDNFFGKTPLHYLFFVICFVFSDLSGLAAYFYKIPIAFYVERMFYLLALYLLLNFAFTSASPENEAISQIEGKLIF